LHQIDLAQPLGSDVAGALLPAALCRRQAASGTMATTSLPRMSVPDT
jgi:hypothetical protein